MFPAVSEGQTTAAIQQYLDQLAGVCGDAPAEPVVRELLARSVCRLHMLCSSLLYRNYPRLVEGPLNLQSEELLDAVVGRLIKAMREVRPGNVRQFFALAGQHMRWELNDLARRLDERGPVLELRDSQICAPPESGGTQCSPALKRILAAIENLPEAEGEAFTLVRVQGMTYPEAAAVLGVSGKTVQRRVSRGVMLLTAQLSDLRLPPEHAALE